MQVRAAGLIGNASVSKLELDVAFWVDHNNLLQCHRIDWPNNNSPSLARVRAFIQHSDSKRPASIQIMSNTNTNPRMSLVADLLQTNVYPCIMRQVTDKHKGMCTFRTVAMASQTFKYRWSFRLHGNISRIYELHSVSIPRTFPGE